MSLIKTSIGLLSEAQVNHLIANARKLRAENTILKEELANFKREASL